MPISTVYTYTNIGIQGHRISIEVDSNKSLPTIEIIGLPDAAIKESKERIRATFRHCGIDLPPKKIVINLAPSDIRKIGTRFDVPIAVAIYSVISQLSDTTLEIIEKGVFFGELGLDGSIKKVQGLLPSVLTAIKQGCTMFFVPEENVSEIESIPDIIIYSLTNFLQIVKVFQDMTMLSPVNFVPIPSLKRSSSSVFSHIKGHETIKRALTIAAAGMHNILLVGPPGSGKTMLAKATNKLLPPLTFDESLEVSNIYSVAGVSHGSGGLCLGRPFRRVHHTASKVSIVGGGQYLTPGEISLAHRGVLFFDELTEFPREVLEVLRQPLEDKSITISRAQGKVDYPADFMFIAAMNPCKCGYYKDKEKPCVCGFNDIKKYQSKISGPMLDRFDMILEVPRTDIGDLLRGMNNNETNKDTYKESVFVAWQTQIKRYTHKPRNMNAQLSSQEIGSYISLGDSEQEFLERAARTYILSPRVIHRIMKVARTIADITQSSSVTVAHLSEAIQYRGKTLFVEQ